MAVPKTTRLPGTMPRPRAVEEQGARSQPAPRSHAVSGPVARPGVRSGPPPIPERASAVSGTRVAAQRPAAPTLLEHAPPLTYHVRPDEEVGVDLVPQPRDPAFGGGLPSALALWRSELLEREVAARKQNFFEVLGLHESATQADVHIRFETLSARFHPDALPPALRLCKPAATKLFARIQRAYEALRDDEARAAHAQCAKSSPLARGAGTARGALDAEGHYHDAQRSLARKDYTQALTEIGEALRLHVCARHEALYGWLLQLSAGSAAVRLHPRALAHIESALRRDPTCADAHYYKAMMHKQLGEQEAAHHHFRRVLRIDPGHMDAAREVRLWEMRRPRANSGLMEKLFGRKPSGR